MNNEPHIILIENSNDPWIILFAEQYEGIYEVLNQYSIRSISFNGLNKTTADRIIKMRPMPTNFVIFARPMEMMNLLQNVLINNYHINHNNNNNTPNC